MLLLYKLVNYRTRTNLRRRAITSLSSKDFLTNWISRYPSDAIIEEYEEI